MNSHENRKVETHAMSGNKIKIGQRFWSVQTAGHGPRRKRYNSGAQGPYDCLYVVPPSGAIRLTRLSFPHIITQEDLFRGALDRRLAQFLTCLHGVST